MDGIYIRDYAQTITIRSNTITRSADNINKVVDDTAQKVLRHPT